MRGGACSVETSYTDTSNLSNASEIMTYSADYSLGGGVTIGSYTLIMNRQPIAKFEQMLTALCQ